MRPARPPRVWFFDNLRPNLLPRHPGVEGVLVPTPGAALLRASGNQVQYTLAGGASGSVRVPAASTRYMAPGRIMLWDPRAGLQRRHALETHTPLRAWVEGVTDVFFDWDGTLSVSEGIVPPVVEHTNPVDPATAHAHFLMGGSDRLAGVGRYLEDLHACGAGPRILTANPVSDVVLTELLRRVCPGIPQSYWLERLPSGVYPGCLPGGSYTRRNILHSQDKMATIGALRSDG